MKKSTMIIYACVIAGVAGVLFLQGKPETPPPVADIKLPALTVAQVQGQKLFEANCSACHGKNAAGTNNGPSFINNIYRPRMHADGAFAIAATTGVRAHHWPFGNMPRVEGVDKRDVALIVQYIRALQQANGIK